MVVTLGNEDVAGGVDSGTFLSSRGFQAVAYGGVTIGDTIGWGAMSFLSGTALASDTVVTSTGTLYLNHGGARAIDADIESGGLLVVLQGSVASDTDLKNGGYASAYVQADFEGATIESGGVLALGGGSANGTVVETDGWLVVSNGGVATNTIIDAGGHVLALPGGAVDGGDRPGVVSTGIVLLADKDIPQLYESAWTGGTVDSGYLYVLAGHDKVSNLVVSAGSDTVYDKPAVILYSGAVAQSDTIEADGTCQYIGSGALASATMVLSGGTEFVESGGMASATHISAGGYETVSGGTLESGLIGNGGSLLLKAGSVSATTVENGGDLTASGGKLSRLNLSSGAEIAFDSADVSTDAISLGTGAVLDFNYLDFSSDSKATLDEATDILTVSATNGSATIHLEGDYTQLYFDMTAAASGTIEITLESVPCYCPGTLILTDRGEIPVEQLAIGDRLMTHSGAARPLRWIGRRAYDGRFIKGRRDVLPVTIQAGALGENLPRRDLTISPLHAMYIDGFLIPAMHLVNGVTINQACCVKNVSYIHLELESHDVIIAEGAPSESFVNDCSRNMFHNAHEFAELYPDADNAPAVYCAPRLESGDHLDEICRRLFNAA